MDKNKVSRCFKILAVGSCLMFIRTPAIPCKETLSKPLSISFASSVHSDIQLVAVWCNLLKVNFCSKGWCQRGVRCRGDTSVEASSTVPIEDRWRRWRSLCTGIRFRLVAGVVFDTDIIYIILYTDAIWYILDDNHTLVLYWRMLDDVARCAVWDSCCEATDMAVRSRKIIQAQGVQICSICSNVFRCV